MAKKKSKNAYDVNVNLDVTSSVTQVTTYVTTFRGISPGVHNSTVTPRKRIRSSKVTTSVSAGWRPPTAYRSAAALRTGFPFSLRNINPLDITVKVEGMSVTRSDGSHGYCPSDATFFSTLGVPTGTTNIGIRAQTEALNKLKSNLVNLSESLAGLRKDVSFIAQRAAELARLAIAARKGIAPLTKQLEQLYGRPNHTAVPKDIANAWLVYQYGIVQTMSDVRHGFDAFKRGLDSKDQLVHAERSVSESATPFFIPSGTWEAGYQSGYSKVGSRVSLWYKISDSYINGLKSYGVSPIAFAWEALGWSFLVDWLLPIGNFLNALDASLGLQFKGGTKTVWRYADLSYEIWPDHSPAILVGTPCRTNYRCFAMDRTVYVTPPLPWLYIKSPFSSAHMANALALIIAARRSDARH